MVIVNVMLISLDNADVKKNRPPNTAFRQQRMRAWQCVLTPKLIVIVFSILAAIYLGFGAYLTYLAHTVSRIGCFLFRNFWR